MAFPYFVPFCAFFRKRDGKRLPLIKNATVSDVSEEYAFLEDPPDERVRLNGLGNADLNLEAVTYE